MTGFSGFAIEGFSSRTSTIRLAASTDIVSMTYIIDTIMSDMRTMKPYVISAEIWPILITVPLLWIAIFEPT